MKLLRLLAALVALTSVARAVDTTPPTLNITHTWIEKRVHPNDKKTYSHFMMYLDPKDETGLPGQIGTIFFRSDLYTTTIPADRPWQMMPWKRGEPFDIGFICSKCVIEIRARDVAGNYSPVQKRYFASPFPYGPAPTFTPVLYFSSTDHVGSATDCRGLFSMQFDGLSTPDIVQVDRATGNVLVRRQFYTVNDVDTVSFSLPPNTIEDSVADDFDGDGRADLIILNSGGLGMYHNEGPDVSGVVQFSYSVLSLTPQTGITTAKHITLGDVTDEGKPDLIVSGTDANGDARLGWLIHDAIWNFNAANGTAAPAGSSPGLVRVADMNGDGRGDVVMVDAANNQMIIFKNKGQGVLAGDGETDANYQPKLIPTGLGNAGPPPNVYPFIAAPVNALAISDVTGDGRPDIVTIIHDFGYFNIADSNDGRTREHWRLYENRSDTYFHPHTAMLLGQSQVSQTSEETFQSDVVIVEMGEDRFPEMVFTNHYGSSFDAPGLAWKNYKNRIKVVRLTPLLGVFNELTTLDDGAGLPELEEQDLVPPSSGAPLESPTRLALGGYPGSRIEFIPMTFPTSNVLRLLQFYTPSSSRPLDIQGGRTTDSDDTGVKGANDAYEYTAFVGEVIEHTLTATNNTDNALTGVFMDSTLMANESLKTDTSDAGWSYVTIKNWGKHVRYTVDIPAHSVVVKHYQTKILSGAVGSKIAGNCLLRQGTANTILVGSAMPIVTIKDPVQFTCTVESLSNIYGSTVYPQESIVYRMRMTNLGTTTASAKALVVKLPGNTTHFYHSPDSVLGVTPVISHTVIVGGTPVTRTVSPWTPNATIALNQKVIGFNNHLYQCTANGISGATEPFWNNALGANATIADGPVTWKHVGTAPLALTSFTWSNFDLPPDDPLTTGVLENERTIEVFVLVKEGLAAGTKITRGTTTFTRSDNTKQTAPAFFTTVLNPLEITLSQDKDTARPGEKVRYTFAVTNHNFFDVTNSKVVDVVPPGMVFVESGKSDDFDSTVSGGTGHFTVFPGYKKNDLTPTSSPVSLDAFNILTWNLGTIPGRVTRNIVFDLQVQHDVPYSYNRGTFQPSVTLSNFSYNFVSNNLLGKRLFALTPTLGATNGSVQEAASLYLLAGNTARTTEISVGGPLDAPDVYVIKFFDGTGKQQVGGETQATLINDPAVTTDGIGQVGFDYGNVGTGTARNAVVRDYLPTGLNFAGFIFKNAAQVTNFSGYHFYDASNKELFFSDAFTDTNGNGFSDPGEAFTDTNGNKKFDGFIASQVRSMELPAGDILPGAAGTFDYAVQATNSTHGYVIVSPSGGMTGVKDGLNYTTLVGYHLRADNLRFPVNGSPKQVKVVISGPAKTEFPVGIVRSRSFNEGADSWQFMIPYEITGALGVNFSNLKMDFDVPRGHKVTLAELIDTTGAAVKTWPPTVGASNTITVTRNAAGVTHITYPLDGRRIAFPTFKVEVDPTTDTKGETLIAGIIKPVVTGKYQKPASPPPAAARASVARGGPTNPPPPVTLPTASTVGTMPSRANLTTGARIFVGRAAPVAVDPGDTFTYIIFYGNLTDVPMSQGVITMDIPKGCIGISATARSGNWKLGINGETGGTMLANSILPKGIANAANNGITWASPLAPTSHVKWSLGSMAPSEGGVVTLTVKVAEASPGSRIDDNTCIFDVANACAKTSGPLGVVVRGGDEAATASAVQERAVDGLQIRNDGSVTASLNQSFTLSSISHHITVGGSDIMEMSNGIGMAPLPGSRVLVVGPPSGVTGNGIRLLYDSPIIRVACGSGNTTDGVKLVDIPSYTPGVLNASALIGGLSDANANILTGGGGNIVAGGGGNIVAAGGGNLKTASVGAKILMPDGTTAVVVQDLTNGGVKLIGHDGSTIVAAGGGNVVVPKGGYIVAAGGGNLIGQDGASVIANDGAGLLGQDGASLVGQDGASVVIGAGTNLITVHSGNLIQGNGVTQGLGK